MNPADKPTALYSIGHSNHSLERFLELLQMHGIQTIADVRSSPYSRYNPQFSRESLQETLKQHGLSYVFLGAELGARRGEMECYRDGKVIYDQVAKTVTFQQGIAELVDIAGKAKVAMLCAEKDPLTCHRAILIGRHISDLVNEVLHILPDGSLETQVQAEQRLLVECNLQDEDLFSTREERLVDAYAQRAAKIAYEETVLNG